jgi:excisionase family DNA binding protein
VPAQTSHDPRRLYSIQEAAQFYRVHPDTIRRRISSGQLTAYRLGGRIIRVDADQVDALLRPIPTVGGDAA